MAHLDSYQALASLHAESASFTPSIPVASLPYIVFVLLASAFFSAFYFTTLPKKPVGSTEIVVGVLASLEVGFGVVALFNAVGVYV